MTKRLWLAVSMLVLATRAFAADFGSPGGPEPANLDEVASLLRQDPYDLELLISFGTSKGGSAGHLALAIRGPEGSDDTVYSANFYADRAPEHAQRHYTDEIMVRVPKMEYLYKTTSSLGPKASFGLDFGEIYKRSVIGVRVYGVPGSEKQALVAFFDRLNDDYRRRAPRTDYHDDEITYGYMNLNCAKTVGAAFKFGAGYTGLEVKNAGPLSGLRVVAATSANLPTEMALKLLAQWHARGHGMDVVLYRKFPGSTFADPHDDKPVPFKDLPNRFPSVLSLDFRAEDGRYEDYDNLYAMHLLDNLGKYSVTVNAATQRLEVRRRSASVAYPEAVQRATRSAEAESKAFLRRVPIRLRESLGDGADEQQFGQLSDPGELVLPRP